MAGPAVNPVKNLGEIFTAEESSLATMVLNTVPKEGVEIDFPYFEQTVENAVFRILHSQCPLPTGFVRDYDQERDKMAGYIRDRRIMEKLVNAGLLKKEGICVPDTPLYRRTEKPFISPTSGAVVT